MIYVLVDVVPLVLKVAMVTFPIFEIGIIIECEVMGMTPLL